MYLKKDIISQFHQAYSKYYEWDEEKFKHVRNIDGLSLKDLSDYYTYMDKRKAYMKRLRSGASSLRSESTNTNISQERIDHFDINSYKVPSYFKMNSNPIIICSYINKIFLNSKTNLRTELLFLSNTKNYDDLAFAGCNSNRQPDLKLNLLYQLKSLNKQSTRPQTVRVQRNNTFNISDSSTHFPTVIQNNKFNRSSLFSPINTFEHMPRKIDYDSYKQLTTDEIEIKPLQFRRGGDQNKANGKGNALTWRSDIKKIFGDYSTITSPSYRVSTAVLHKATAAISGNQVSGSTDKNGLNSSFKESGASSMSGMDGGVNNTGLGSNSNSAKGSRLSNVYVIKPSSSMNANGGEKGEKSKSGASGNNGGQLGGGNQSNQKFDIYMVPGMLLGNSKKNK